MGKLKNRFFMIQDPADQTIPQAGGTQPVGQTPPPSGGTPVPAGTTPTAGQTPQAAEPVAEENYLRPRPPDGELGIGFIGDYQTTIQVPAHPNTIFDEVYFLKMLSGSISLTKNEKKKIVESVSKLSQYQIDELIKIFEEERRKFAELDEKHQVKIRELQQKQAEDWKDLEMDKQAVAQKNEEEAKAEALRAKLMGAKPTVTKCPHCLGELSDPSAKICPHCQAGL